MSEPSSPLPRKRGFLRGWRRWLALGFAVLLLLVLCLPWIAAPLAPGFAARAFSERCAGRLGLGSAELSWFGRQALRDAVLSDPEGREVARVDVEFPSLWQLARGGGHDLGRIQVKLQAALVADEQGVTNLERALAPRSPSAPAPASGSGSGPSAGPAAEPELDLELESPLCSWSDAHTRAAGGSFEVRDLRVVLGLHPGAPARFEARARLSGEQPGAIEVEGEVAGLRTQGTPGFTKARARGKVQGFSSAMLDGLAQQHGRLAEVLGPRFDFSFELGDLGPSSGTISCALQSERTHLVLEGRVQDGVLRCTDQRGFALEIGEPRAFVASYLEPYLPPGTSLVWPDRDSPWKLECPTLALPIPTQAPAGLAGLAELLARVEVDARLSIPGPIGFRNELTRGIHLDPALSGLVCKLQSGAGKPLTASLDARLIAGETGKLQATLSAAEPWAALGRGEAPVVDAHVGVQDLSNATLDALLGREAFLAEGLGRVLDLSVDLKQTSLAGGTISAGLHSANIDLELRGAIADGNFVGASENALELRFGPPPAWVERQLAASLPSGTALKLAAQPFGAKVQNLSFSPRATSLDELLASAQANLELDAPALRLTLPGGRALGLSVSTTRLSLGRGGRVAWRIDTALAEPGPARCVLQGDFAGLGGLLRGELPPLSFDLALEKLPLASLDPWLTGDGRVPALLGERLDLRLRAEQLGLRSGSLDLLAHAEKLDARLALACEKDVWKSSGAETDRVTLALAPADLARELGPYLPAGTTLALDPESPGLDLHVREFSLALPADPAQLLSAARAKLELDLPGLSFANELTRAAKIAPALAGAHASAELGAAGELALLFDARLGGAGDARLHAEARGSSLAQGRAALRIDALPASIVDALAGQPAAVSGLLGETLALEGEFVLAAGGKGELHFALHAPHGEIAAAGRLEPGAFVLAEPQGLHVRLEPSDAWLAGQLAGRLPAGASLRRAEGVARPFELGLHSERIALPQGEQSLLAALSGTVARLEAQLPDLAWSEAGGPTLELRELALSAELTQKPGSSLKLSGKLGGDPPGDLAFEFRALDALALAGEEGGLGRFRIAAQGSAHGVPVGVVDALAGQGGLLVEALGARADLTLRSEGISREAGSFVVDLASPQGPAHFEGEMQGGMLRVTKPKGMSAHFSLGPLTSTRFVGRVVPLVCEVTKPGGAAPASIEVDALALPLDGDLSKLDGTLRLDLGEISYAILPGMKGLFGSLAAQKPVKLPAFAVPIQKGVVHYEKLLLPIGGREYAFHGSYSLVDGGMVLGTEIPLELLGSKINSELDKARGLIDGKTLVPIEIRGTFSKPRFAIGQGFLDSIVKKALGGALEKGLEGLLKKKKP